LTDKVFFDNLCLESLQINQNEGLSLPSFSPFSYQEKIKDAPTGVGFGMSFFI